MIPFTTIDWSTIEKNEVKGEKGLAYWQIIQLPGIRIRQVEYSGDFLVDHWCQKGHIIHCLSGSFTTELSTGEKVLLKANDSFIVSDDASSHLTYSENGAQLLIIDGDFLKP
jgi:quercetin dioxygenase-like cupin family protein